MVEKPHFIKCGPVPTLRDWRKLPSNELTRAERNMRFVEKYLKAPGGSHVGKPIVLAPFQENFFYAVFDNPYTTRTAILSKARKNAKALALDTPIPTPKGWKTMGDIKTGDYVYGSDGKPVKVIAESEIFTEKECYKLTFSDGSQIVASEDHIWTTKHKYRPWEGKTGRYFTKGFNKRPVIANVTTSQIKESLRIERSDGNTENNHSVPVNAPLAADEKHLLVHPYTLGAWLGDGKTAGASLTCGDEDLEHMVGMLELFEKNVSVHKSENRSNTIKISTSVGNGRKKTSLRVRLREIGVLGNKHIPDCYFESSIEQRIQLLQGLMDTDGTVNKCGGKYPRASFCNKNYDLVYGVWRLLRSLGLKSKIIQTRAKLYDKDYGMCYKVEFTVPKNFPVFSLMRKQNLLPDEIGKRSKSIQIVGCEYVGKIPCKCIAVDSEDHLFLAGHGCIPTHNTATIAMIVLCYLVGPEAIKNGVIVSGARSQKQAGMIFRMARSMVTQSEKLQSLIKIIPSSKELHGLAMGTVYTALSAEGKTAHGDGPLVAILDEAGQVSGPYDAFFEAIITSQGAYENPILFVISTQAATDGDWLSIQIDDAVTSQNPRTVCHLYAADNDCDVKDEEQWRKANPAYDYFFPKQELVDASDKAERMPSFQNTFRNLHLNQRISVNSPFVSKDVWQQNGEVAGSLKGKKVYGGLDLSAVSDLTGLVLIGEGGDVECYAWLPAEGLLEKSKNDRVPYDVWAKQGYLTTTPGRAIEYEWVAHQLRRIFTEYDVQQINFDRFNMKFLRPWLERAGFTAKELEKFVEMGQGFVSMGPAVRALEAALLQKQLKHSNNPILTMCAGNAVVESDAAGNRKFTKKKATGRIDLIVCMAMAEDARSAHKKPASGEWSLHFL